MNDKRMNRFYVTAANGAHLKTDEDVELKDTSPGIAYIVHLCRVGCDKGPNDNG